MKKAGLLVIGTIIAVAFVANVCAQMPPKPDKVPPPATHNGSVVSMQGTTLTVSGGGKGGTGTTAFNTATAIWQGYSSPSQVKAGDNVQVTYSGSVGGVKTAIRVAKMGSASAGTSSPSGPAKGSTRTSR